MMEHEIAEPSARYIAESFAEVVEDIRVNYIKGGFGYSPFKFKRPIIMIPFEFIYSNVLNRLSCMLRNGYDIDNDYVRSIDFINSCFIMSTINYEIKRLSSFVGVCPGKYFYQAFTFSNRYLLNGLERREQERIENFKKIISDEHEKNLCIWKYKMNNVHIELLYTPDLSFYKQRISDVTRQNFNLN